MKFFTQHFAATTPATLRKQQLDKLSLMLVRAELALDQATHDLAYINAAINRLEASSRGEVPKICI